MYSLGLSAPADSFTKDLDTMVTNAGEKYKNHSGIKAIKASLSQADRFEFSTWSCLPLGRDGANRGNRSK